MWSRVARKASNPPFGFRRGSLDAIIVSVKAGVYVKHCKTEFMKQVLPKLQRPPPCMQRAA